MRTMQKGGREVKIFFHIKIKTATSTDNDALDPHVGVLVQPDLDSVLVLQKPKDQRLQEKN